MNLDLNNLIFGLARVIIEETQKNPEFKAKLEDVFVQYGQVVIEKAEVKPVEKVDIDVPEPEKKEDTNTLKPEEKKPDDSQLAPPSTEKSLEELYQEDQGFSLAQVLNEKNVSLLRNMAKERDLKVNSKTRKSDLIRLIEEDVKKNVEAGSSESGAPAQDASKAEDSSKEEKKEKEENKKDKKKPVEKDDQEGEEDFDAKEFSPVKVFLEQEEGGLRSILEKRSIKELREIIRYNAMDPGKITKNWKNKEKLIAHILEMTESRATQGDAFRNYKY